MVIDEEVNGYIAEFFKVLSDPVRIGILKLLKDTKKNATEIQDILDISQSYTSQQLNVLIKAGLLDIERIDNIKTYSVRHNEIFKVLSAVNSMILDIEKEKYAKIKKSDDLDLLV